MSFNLVTILGPTAVGKTNLAAKIAHRFNGEIISADSRQVYKGMNLGTGKDYDDYNVDNTKIAYHLIDILEPNIDYSVYDFQNNFFKSFDQINKKNKLPILCGGTNLYIHSILKKYELSDVSFNSAEFKTLLNHDFDQLKNILVSESKSLHNKTDLTDKERIAKAILVNRSNKEIPNYPKINSLNICIDAPRELIKTRITNRLKERLSKGLIDEVKNLIDSGKVDYNRLSYFGLEYKYIGLFLEEELSYNDMFQKLNSAIHNFAKKQSTWLRKIEREGIKLYRIKENYFEESVRIIEENFAK